jgi:hypothetical protein
MWGCGDSVSKRRVAPAYSAVGKEKGTGGGGGRAETIDARLGDPRLLESFELNPAENLLPAAHRAPPMSFLLLRFHAASLRIP